MDLLFRVWGERESMLSDGFVAPVTMEDLNKVLRLLPMARTRTGLWFYNPPRNGIRGKRKRVVAAVRKVFNVSFSDANKIVSHTWNQQLGRIPNE